MEYSIFSWFSYKFSVEKRLELIKEAGFDGVMLWWGEEERLLHPRIARDIGLEVENVHAPFARANSIWIKGDKGDEYTNSLINCVQECSMLHIPTLVVHINNFRNLEPVSELGLHRILSLVSYAEKMNVTIAIENAIHLEPLEYVFENIISDNLGFCYDSGHENYEKEYADYLNLFGDRLIATHLSDNFGDADTHLLPFDGLSNWEKISYDLANSKALDFITLEVNFDIDDDESRIYDELSAREYLNIAFNRALKIHEMMKK